ncbi:DNA polymerase Y family protein [Granulosicoccaceae sp. 1_MG-2023]|nr:DNA polymerase Y family protein [Granulosicoccaceae sp. 1_MG-2023]
MLWLALFFPQLLIDSAGTPADLPQLVAGRRQQRRLVVQCNRAARALGIHPSQALNAALGLCPDITVHEEDTALQQTHLHDQALHALQYSSLVSTRGDQLVLLEIAGSLKLFGGEQALLQRIISDFRQRGLALQSGVGPTPLAAELLARAGVTQAVRSCDELPARISPISTAFLPFDAAVCASLHKAGLRECGQLLALPVDAITRRFGQQTGQQLYRLLGKLPDPQVQIQAQAQFRRSLDLALETDNSHILQFTLNRLLTALSGFLRVRDCGVTELELTLQHRHIAPTCLRPRFSQPVCRRRHLLRICMEHLSRTRLPGPVLQITLSASQLLPMRYQTTPLLHDDKQSHGQDSLADLRDRLCARLGEEALYQLAVHDAHWPEQAWQRKPASEPAGTTAAGFPLRPLWLLSTPQTARCALRTGQTERIEGDWYQNGGQRRDYALARDPVNGRWYWVFREDGNSAWQIHGLFA